ncbi:MAG TPA: helix-hairpin-helix domain-containing protein [Roseiflexaceae bacterium]|nr:helix-hairpin-helix domain-containing protein [Roseiflexaceae bacterium]
MRHLVTVQEVADDAQLPVRNATVRPKVIDTVLQTTANPAAVAEPSVPATPAVDTAEPEVADDLTKIEGVGPKIADLLAGAGYATYADLGQADVATLRALLADAKLPMAKPDTWPEQAQLAAAGDWEALELLQQRLVAGRSESE